MSPAPSADLLPCFRLLTTSTQTIHDHFRLAPETNTAASLARHMNDRPALQCGSSSGLPSRPPSAVRGGYCALGATPNGARRPRNDAEKGTHHALPHPVP